MDDMNVFERQLADESLRIVGPSRPVNDAAIFTAITTTQSPKWRFQSVLSATKLVAAVVIVALSGGFVLTSTLRQGPDDGQELSAAATAPAVSVSPMPTDGSAVDRHTLVVNGVTLSIEARTGPHPEDLPLLEGGEGHPTIADDVYPPWWQGPDDLKDGLYISRDTSGSQAAEAMMLWTTFPGSQLARPCLLDPSAGASPADLADAVATAPGTKLVSGPVDATVGGHAAQLVVVTVAPDAFLEEVSGGARTRTMGCSPGYFFGWEAVDGGAFWQETLPGDTIKVWIVAVDGRLLFIEAATHPEAGAAVAQEIDDIIGSVRFE